MAVLLSDVVETARDWLIGDFRPTLNTLAADPGSNGTSVVLAQADGQIQRGAVLSVDLELMYVTAWDPVALTATVIRGYRGTTGTAHSSGSVVEVNARFPGARIAREALRELVQLPPGLFVPNSAVYSVNAGDRIIALTSG
jgi:hypothetical protein